MSVDENDDSSTEEENEESQTEEKPAGSGESDDGLKSALAKERNARKEAVRQLKAAEKQVEDLKNQGASAIDVAKAEGKLEGKKEALDSIGPRFIEAQIVAAAGRLRKPEYAARLVDKSSLTIDDDGNVDKDSLKAAIDQLLKDDPTLAATPALPGSKPRPGQSGRSGGVTADERIRNLVNIRRGQR